MERNGWLNKGYQISDTSTIRRLELYNDEVQVFLTNHDSHAVVVDEELLYRWIEQGIVSDVLFSEIYLPDKKRYIFISKPDYMVSSVQEGPFPYNNLEARGFAVALRETRKITPNISLHDAIYIEQISRLLPTYSFAEDIDDKTVLGSWLSGGVKISTDDFIRLRKLVGWMDPHELKITVTSAGFDIPDGGQYLTKQKPQSIDNQDGNSDEQLDQHAVGKSRNTRFTLTGRPFLEEFFNENVLDIIFNEERYKTMGIDFPSAIILYGPPGCGKTYAVEKLVEFIDWPYYSIDSSSVASPFIHDTSKKIAEIFNQAIENAPSIVVIDEMEAYLTDRNTGQSSGLHHVEEVAEFLRRIPEALKNRVLIIAMTNKIDMIDSAILRRGRFDHVVEIRMPSYEEVLVLIQTLFDKLPTSDDIDVDIMATKLAGRPMSDVAFAVREAGRIAVKNNKLAIDNDCIFLALQQVDIRNEEEGRRIGFR